MALGWTVRLDGFGFSVLIITTIAAFTAVHCHSEQIGSVSSKTLESFTAIFKPYAAVPVFPFQVGVGMVLGILTPKCPFWDFRIVLLSYCELGLYLEPPAGIEPAPY
jgi:hypothetical protein